MKEGIGVEEGEGEREGVVEASVLPRAHIWLWPHVLLDISRRPASCSVTRPGYLRT